MNDLLEALQSPCSCPLTSLSPFECLSTCLGHIPACLPKETGLATQAEVAGVVLWVCSTPRSPGWLWGGGAEAAAPCEGVPHPMCLWAAVIALFCRQYDIIKDNDSNNNKEKTKPSSEHSTPERPSGGLLRSKVSGQGCQEGWHLLGMAAWTVCLSPGMETPQPVLSPQRLRAFRVQ